MAHRSQKAIGLMLVFSGLPLVATDLTFQVRHERLLRDRTCTLTFNENGVAYQEVDPKGKKQPEQLHRGRWNYSDIRQIYLGDSEVVVLSYKDRSRWLLGVDKEYEFELLPGQDLKPAYDLLKRRLDRRFVAAIADSTVSVGWELPAKRLGVLRGSEGVLKFSAAHIIYETQAEDASRTWRFQDIANISTADPYQLTITSYERAVTHYGSRKDFNFQLKAPLSERRFQVLWRRLNQDKGLAFLTAAQEDGP